MPSASQRTNPRKSFTKALRNLCRRLHKGRRLLCVWIGKGPQQKSCFASYHAALKDKADDGHHSIDAGASVELVAVCRPAAGERSLSHGKSAPMRLVELKSRQGIKLHAKRGGVALLLARDCRCCRSRDLESPLTSCPVSSNAPSIVLEPTGTHKGSLVRLPHKVDGRARLWVLLEPAATLAINFSRLLATSNSRMTSASIVESIHRVKKKSMRSESAFPNFSFARSFKILTLD